MAIDAQIPLSGAQQPSFAQQAGEVYQLAGAIEKQREAQAQRQDQQIIQEAIKNGANLETPDGIAASIEQLRGKVSPKTFQVLSQSLQESKMNEAKMREHYAKASESELNAYGQKMEFMGQNVEEPLRVYDEAIQSGKTPEEANLAFENAKAQRKQHIENMPQVGGEPLMPPAVLQQYMAGNPAQFKAKRETLKSYQDTMKAGVDMRAKEQSIRTDQAREASLRNKGTALVDDEITQSGATGQELLAMLPPGDAAIVQAVQEGRMQLTEIPARGKQRQKIIQLVNQYDPNFVAYMGKTKAAVEKDFTSGVAARNITSINTAIGHLGSLSKLGEAMENGDIKTVNRLVNAAKTEFGNPSATSYELAQIAVGEELMRTFRGVGASVTEAEQWKSKLDGSLTPQQQRSVIKAAAELLESRIAAIDNQYKRGTKSEKGYQDILDPKAVNTLSSFTGKDYWSMYNLSGKGRDSSENSEKRNTGKSTSVPHGTAPAGAIEKLKQNPQLKDQFKAKYGYLPEGM